MVKRITTREPLNLSDKPTVHQNPISRYNHIVFHYNDRINNKNSILLDYAYTDKMYRFWYYMSTRLFFLLLILYLAPYLTFITLCISLYTVIIHENAMQVYRSNLKKVPNMFENMIFDEALCKSGSGHYLYFSVKPQDLESFQFPPTTKDVLRNREDEGKVNFMVYDRVFLEWSEGLRKPRWILWLHVLANLALFIIMQYFVYTPLFCFDMLHPITSITKCGSETVQYTLF
ncbi:unnamed protein product [Blepharisma stoltei]|uniref:Uncharacterized protein n=1 Tax=Blepharisma stoltei TaxID=1481888 RepID=A0AAU9K3F2_9CILI|nr:unnamed protein product [Blepharisma stoltei]